SRVWIIDPLDGTKEFATPGRTDWAVHVALSVDGVPTIGAVALPDGTVLTTGDPPRPQPRTAPSADQAADHAADRFADPAPPLRLLVSASRPPAMALEVARRLGAEVVPLGSAGAKVAAVLHGRAELYLHAGGMRQWDSCAPAAVALAGGFWASRVDGSPLRYNEADVNLPDLLVCRPELASQALSAIAIASAIADADAG
ncbi:MAG: inositol monophosphatase family protein, partial [Acidimicrobiales bacterium]